jgi:hypothetical protein
VSTDHPETAASVNIGPITCARCAEAGCENLGRVLMIYADARGRTISPVVCHEHARRRLARDHDAAGLKVFDEREGP